MTSQMLSRQMVEEELVVEEVSLTEVAPRMGQYLSLLVITRVSELYVGFQLLGWIDSLLSDEDQSTLETYLTKSLLMSHFQMSLKSFIALVLIAGIAICNHAMQ
jgi:hypothetical protein